MHKTRSSSVCLTDGYYLRVEDRNSFGVFAKGNGGEPELKLASPLDELGLADASILEYRRPTAVASAQLLGGGN
jgi:hypothetical protein